MKYGFDIVNPTDNKMAYGTKKTFTVNGYSIINGVKTNIRVMQRLVVETPPLFPGEIVYIYDR